MARGESEAAPPPGGGTSGRSQGSARILVVEDDPATLRFVSLALERAGFTLATATAAPAAFELLGADTFDVLLADIGLPGMSGFDLVHQARRANPGLAIALMTADANVQVAVDALRSDVDDFLSKPISPTALVASIERVLARRRARHVPDRVLAVGAHPDDVEIGVGGTLFGHRAAGSEITILTLSHGARGGDGLRRADEAKRAAALLGAELMLMDLEDTRVSESDPTLGIIERVIGASRPTVVYTHTASDLHQDHRNVHQATMVAARRVPNVYCYESPSATVKFEPRRFSPIDDYLDTKVVLIGAYTSQIELRSYLAEDLVRSTARYWGRYGDARYCEPLEVVRDRPTAQPKPATGDRAVPADRLPEAQAARP